MNDAMVSGKLFEVSDDTLEKVAKALNYPSVYLLNEDVKRIEEWMKTQPHLPEIMDDKRIQNFLILNKGSVERAKEKIDNYYSMRTRFPEIFDNANPKLPYMKHILDTAYLVPLPKLTKDGYRVFLSKVRKTTFFENHNPIHVVRHLVNLQELRLFEDITYGDIFIFDGKDVPLSVALQITPALIYKALVAIYKDVFSNRVKAIYIINAPLYTGKIITLFKSILKPKILSRIHVCPNPDFLIEELGKEILPKDFGGKEKFLDEIQGILAQKFNEYEGHYNKMDKVRVNENLRPQKLRNDEMLGYHGNFKSLEVD